MRNVHRALALGVPWLLACSIGFPLTGRAQDTPQSPTSAATQPSEPNSVTSPPRSKYFDPLQGQTAAELIRQALAGNKELIAARLEIDRARARVRQTGLLPNPSLEVETTTGSLTASKGENSTSVGLSVPIELGGKRGRRIALAQAELAAAEAEVANRERMLAAEVRAQFVEALAALRELELIDRTEQLGLQTVRIVQIRVNEGESAPIELNQLRADTDRLRSRRPLVEGRLDAAILRLQATVGMTPGEPLRLREALAAIELPPPPGTAEAAVDIALRTRPDLRLARLTEEVAQAGYRLVRAQSTPDLAAFARFTVTQSTIDDTPVGLLSDRDKLMTFGVTIGLPVFNRNQGAKAEAALGIEQARQRREFQQALVRSEVLGSYARYEAANRAALTFQQGVIERSEENIRIIRAAYELGEYRLTELLLEQRRLAEAQQELTEALTERYRARMDLQTALGIPIATGEETQK